jgi:hypothetical protein
MNPAGGQKGRQQQDFLQPLFFLPCRDNITKCGPNNEKNVAQ